MTDTGVPSGSPETVKRWSPGGKPQKLKLARKLPMKKAIAIAKKKSTKDYRGTHYNPATGTATLT
jgi:hypothetical protein